MVNDNYYLALTIKERVLAFRKAGFDLVTDSVYLDRWLNIRGLSSINETKQLCDMNGITLDEFTYALKPFEKYEVKVLNDAVGKSEWYITLNEVMSHFANSPEKLDKLSSNIVYPVRPFVMYFLQKISDKIIEIENVKLTQQALEQITEWISGTLANIVIKIVTVGIHNFKESIETDENIFEIYMRENFGNEQLLEDFYNDYPTMTRMLVKKMLLSINHVSNVIERIAVNKDSINQFIKLDEITVNAFMFGQGDSHSGGQAVVVVEFLSGEKVVYKPKNLKVERQFNKLLDWFNKKDNSFLLNMAYGQAIYHEEYTINEYIMAEECSCVSDVKQYYRRLGQLLFILYTLNGTDFHFENIISSRGNAYLIDLETIFQIANVDILPNLDNADGRIYKTFGESVLCIGILPLLGFNQNAEGKSVDISALNGGKQKLPYKVLGLKNVNTPDMIFDYDYPELSETDNIPMLNGHKQLFGEYSEDLIAGFQAMQEFIENNKDEYKHQIIELFGIDDIYVRQLTKATANYAVLLQYENHPNYLRDMVYMEKLMENLMSYPYKDKRIVAYEIKDMLNGDIPIFFSTLTTKSISCSIFGQINDYFSMTPLDKVIEKINLITPASNAEQKWMLLNSIGKTKEKRLNTINDINNESVEVLDVNQEKVYRTIDLINYNILNQRVFSLTNDDFTWIKYKDINVQLEPVDIMYFSGLAGIGTYFYYLSEITNQDEFAKIFNSIVRRLDEVPTKAYDQNPTLLSNLYLFSLLKESMIDTYNKYLVYVKSLLDKVLLKQVVLTDLQLRIFYKVVIAFLYQESDEIYKKSIDSLADMVNINLHNFEVDDALFLNNGINPNQSIRQKIIEYSDEILENTIIDIWHKSQKDSYSDGVLYIVNALIDTFQLTNNQKYLDFAKKLLEMTICSFEKNSTFRLFTEISKMDVSLNDGYCGLNYSLLRAFANCKLPNILTLNAVFCKN